MRAARYWILLSRLLMTAAHQTLTGLVAGEVHRSTMRHTWYVSEGVSH
jgi:hypothetical protein